MSCNDVEKQQPPPGASAAMFSHDSPSRSPDTTPTDDTGGSLPLSVHSKHGSGRSESVEPVSVKLTPRLFMSLVAMSFLWTASQIPVYLYGGIPPQVYGDIGGSDRWIWFITGNLLGSAAICPFSGALSDLLGRRHVAIAGMSLLIVGQVVCATAKDMEMFIAGMTVSGVGAGINELTALAGTAELAPASRRGFWVASVVVTVLPFMPSVMYAQLIAAYTSWRYVGVLTAAWSFAGLVCVLLFYFPPPRVNSSGLSRVDIVRRIDFIGGLLSITGIVLFTCGLLWGGYQYPWTDTHTLAPLLVGVVLMVAFVCWEVWGAAYPMFPRRLGRATKELALILVITFISGSAFFSIIMLWPSHSTNVYGHDPVQQGYRGMPFAFGIIAGAVVSLFLLKWVRGQVRWLLLGASVVLTVGCGSMAAARMDNLQAVYGMLFVAGLGCGGVMLPASLVATFICPDDLMATVTALVLAVRVVGGALGFSVYYNVFRGKLAPRLGAALAAVCMRNGIREGQKIGAIVELTAASLTERILPLVGDREVWEEIVMAGQRAYESSYPWVYYCSIAFGAVAVVASVFMGDISGYMDDHIPVVMR